MQNLQVSNFISNNGNKIANQFKIRTNKGYYFQSYDSIIVFIPKGINKQIQLDSHYWDYSKTTGKYRNHFLGENITETRRKIKEGIYKLKNLNK
tara:strand:+ start:493 stop:774 length:282 start_codon:yes stop_codon:yes gene_type:complete